MKKIDIEKQASEIVRSYMDKGYHLVDCPNYIGDGVRWDVTNRKERIEVVICQKAFEDNPIVCSFGYSLSIYKSGDLNGESRNKRELMSEFDYYYIGSDWYGSLEEAKAAEAVREEKRCLACDVAWYSHKRRNKLLNSDAAHKLIVPYVREHGYRCKSAKAFDIGGIIRGECGSRKGFYIQVRNDWKFFPFKRLY